MTLLPPISGSFSLNAERGTTFSIAKLDPWDFWAKKGQVTLPDGVTQEQARQIIIMAAIGLRDRPVESERRN